MENIYKGLVYISAGSVLVPIIISVKRFKTFNEVLKVLFFYLLFSFFFELTSEYFSYSLSLNNVVLNLYTIFEFVSLTIIYYLHFKSRRYKLISLISICLFSFTAIAYFIFVKDLYITDSVVSVVEAAFLIFISGISNYYMVVDETLPDLRHYYFFWINTAFLLYFSAALILFLSSGFIEKASKNVGYTLWGLMQLFNIFTNILISIGLWKAKLTLR